jgi:hypothetical protein
MVGEGRRFIYSFIILYPVDHNTLIYDMSLYIIIDVRHDYGINLLEIYLILYICLSVANITEFFTAIIF